MLLEVGKFRYVLKAGTLEHRNTGTPEHWNTGTPRNTPEHQGTPRNTRTPRNTGMAQNIPEHRIWRCRKLSGNLFQAPCQRNYSSQVTSANSIPFSEYAFFCKLIFHVFCYSYSQMRMARILPKEYTHSWYLKWRTGRLQVIDLFRLVFVYPLQTASYSLANKISIHIHATIWKFLKTMIT